MTGFIYWKYLGLMFFTPVNYKLCSIRSQILYYLNLTCSLFGAMYFITLKCIYFSKYILNIFLKHVPLFDDNGRSQVYVRYTTDANMLSSAYSIAI